MRGALWVGSQPSAVRSMLIPLGDACVFFIEVAAMRMDSEPQRHDADTVNPFCLSERSEERREA